jgi:putative chitobiose transport system permease protein
MTTTQDVQNASAAPLIERTTRRRRKPLGFDHVGGWEMAWRYVLLIFVLIITLGPFIWELSTSLKGPGEDIYTSSLSLIPHDPTLGNYVKVFNALPIFGYIGNSLIVAAIDVFGNIVFATLAGFALARMRFRGHKFVLGLFLATLVLPGEVTIIAQFVTIRTLGLADSLLGVALPGMIAALNVLLMYNAFRVLPMEIDEASMIDGANTWQRLWSIALPGVRGTIAVIAIFSFIGAWDDFLWPLIVLTSPEHFTLTIGLQYLSGTFATDQRMISAGTMIAFIPIAIVFSVLQRFFFKGVEEGGVKG